MKKKTIKEYHGLQHPSYAGGPGAGSNFYSGKDLGAHTPGSLGTRGADSNFSRRMQALVPNDYYELLEEDEEETEEYLTQSFNSNLFKESLEKRTLCFLLEEYEKIDEDMEEAEEEELEEFSGAGAIAIGTLPLGRSTKGKKGQHSSNSGGKSFPYSKENRRKFKNYSRKTFGGSK